MNRYIIYSFVTCSASSSSVTKPSLVNKSFTLGLRSLFLTHKAMDASSACMLVSSTNVFICLIDWQA